MPRSKKVYHQPPIRVRGARTHNLKSVDVEFPAGKLTVVTGLSGSGKSSLAFDTVFAEGQRRYVESLSTYARQFIARMPRPPVDSIDHIPPAIALEQKNSVRNARSTIGTATEINDFLRLIYAKIAVLHCPNGHGPVTADTPYTVAEAIHQWPEGTRYFLLAPVELESAERLEGTLAEMKRQGFTRLYVGETLIDLDDPATKIPKNLTAFHVLVDRLVVRETNRTRLADAIPFAFRIGQGRLLARTTEGEERAFHADMACNTCGWRGRPLEPRLFSFSNPLGACPTCQGFGRVTGLDWDRIIPDPTLAIEEGTIAPWRGESGSEMLDVLRENNHVLKIPLWRAWKDLTDRQRRIVIEGQDGWPGIQGYFDWLESKRYKVQARIQIARYRGYTKCPDCNGDRLVPEARLALVEGKAITELWRMNVEELRAWFGALKLPKDDLQTVERALREVRSRLDYLSEVGLGYLTLNRQTRTLSGGESQRINLATALGSALTETLYVLDEPTVGLHPRDTDRLVTILKRLTALENTVIVVEHDLDVIRSADWLVDIGPRAGEHGGEVVFCGTPAQLAAETSEASQTARFIGNEKVTKKLNRSRAITRFGRREPRGWITVKGAHENNLDYLTVRFPLGVLCAVTGVSGSGKSSLVKSCLWANYRRERGEVDVEPGRITGLEGFEAVGDVILVDQEPIGRSARSNAATYLKAYDGIRRLMAETSEAKHLGLEPRDFSFNVTGGRCEACEGTGRQVIDMQFLADVEVVCDACEGQRFQDRVLGVHWKGLNINGILDLTVEEAIGFFDGHRAIVRGLQPLADVGLGYLRLGQATNTLSGGEAQRLKLASHLALAGRGNANALLVFDEPTTGLHAADLEVLLAVFEQALEKGFSLLVIEHNLELIRRADWIIDLGPDGGPNGGRLVAQGPPEDIAACKQSLTGKYLTRS
ncbi:MAG: excinuclease subunit [Candidatus Sumerlaeota bacterium]|nr:excinuclease subunit [Candidatus Sumerlaeota bacterium]